MTIKLWQSYRDRYEFIVTFANTGEENEETLIFVNRCAEHFEIPVVWLEAIVHPEHGAGTTHRIVDFATASRKAEPFEEVIKKYGIPNKAYLHCTRELKEAPIRSYMRSIGWNAGTYHIAIGIRADEPERRAKRPERVYPLLDWFPTTKPEINDWWEDQPFNLNLQEHQGNCKTCWKKSLSKLVRIANETPQYFDFNLRMEHQYGLAGHNVDGTPRTFFRNHMRTEDILALRGQSVAPPRPDDENWGCSESCEAFG